MKEDTKPFTAAALGTMRANDACSSEGGLCDQIYRVKLGCRLEVRETTPCHTHPGRHFEAKQGPHQINSEACCYSGRIKGQKGTVRKDEGPESFLIEASTHK